MTPSGEWVTAPVTVAGERDNDPWSSWNQFAGNWNVGNTLYFDVVHAGATVEGRWNAVGARMGSALVKVPGSEGIATNSFYGLGQLLWQLNDLMDTELIQSIASYVQHLIEAFVDFIGQPFVLPPARQSERLRAQLLPAIEFPDIKLKLDQD
jgi:hypothetical protein